MPVVTSKPEVESEGNNSKIRCVFNIQQTVYFATGPHHLAGRVFCVFVFCIWVTCALSLLVSAKNETYIVNRTASTVRQLLLPTEILRITVFLLRSIPPLRCPSLYASKRPACPSAVASQWMRKRTPMMCKTTYCRQ